MRPTFNSIPLADGLRWKPDPSMWLEEKKDGVWHVEDLPHAQVVGELLKDGSFFAFDILTLDGQDLRPLPLSERLLALDGLNLPRPASGSGGAFLRSVIEHGGEGVVAKPLHGAWGCPWTKCKRCQVFYCRVTDLDQWHGSVVLADSVTGELRGKMAFHSKFDLVRVGSVLKIEAYGLTARGLLREARPDRDAPESWLLSF